MGANKSIRNLFLKMNTDSSQIKQDNVSFYDALDLRLISDEALSNGALVNFKGTKARLRLGNTSGGTEVELKGYDYIGDTLLLLMYNVYGDYSFIAKANILEDYPTYYGNPDIPSILGVYSDVNSTTKLNFNSVEYIGTATRYESDLSEKLYFAVKGEPLRYINIIDPPESSEDASILDIIPNNDGGNINIDSLVEGGNLQAGKIQYCYRLFKKYGAETTFSTTSEMINLTSSTPKGNIEFTGSDLETNVNKSVKISIAGLDNTFDYINIYSIFYSQKGLPVVNLVGELPIISDSISYIDKGNVLDTITLEEFNSFGGRLFSANDIETKNNILFAAGIQEDSDDIDIDCRAYRFDSLINDEDNASIIITIKKDIFTEVDLNNQQIQLVLPDGTNATLTAKTSLPVDNTAGEFYVDSIINKPTIVAGLILDAFLTSYGAAGTVSANPNIIADMLVTSTNNINQWSIIITYTAPTTGTFSISNSENWFSFTTTPYSSSISKVTSKLYQQTSGYYELESNGYFKSVNITPPVSGNDWLIPEDADCINKYNNEFLQTADDYSTSHPYPYDKAADGIYYGGTGPIVSYKIELESTSHQLTESGYQTIVNDSNKDFILQSSSHKQGEVYRYALNFYDLKGRPYFAKWIGDIRIPYLDIFSITDTSISTKNIIITFSINLTNISTDILNKISGCRLARVERTQPDKSIITQGASWIVANNTYNDTSSTKCNSFMHKSVPLGVNSSGKYFIQNDFENEEGVADDIRKNYIHPLYSPELFYNDGIDLSNNDYKIKVVNIINNTKKAHFGANNIIHTDDTDGTIGSSSSIIYPTTTSINIENIEVGQLFNTIISNKLHRSESETIGMAVTLTNEEIAPNKRNITFSNRVYPYTQRTGNLVDDYDFMTMYGPTSGIFFTNVPIIKVANYNLIYILDIYINNSESRYGGNTYYDRLLNSYTPIGDFIKIIGADTYNITSSDCDTYNTIFDSLTSMSDPKIEDVSADFDDPVFDITYVHREQICALLPLESNINCTLVNFKPSKYVLNVLYASGSNQDSDKIGLQETTLQGVELYGDKYPTEFKDLNSYNTAYSSVPIYPTTEPKPQLFEESINKGTTIIASESKSEGEIIDSWTKFLYSNIIEVESEYGDIHRLEVFKNKLYYFQENGIGNIAVNERYIISNGDAGQLALGSGGILERFDYLKYNEGIIDPRHLINAKSSIYFIDHNRRVLDNIDSGDQCLSTALNINSIFRSLYTNKDSHVAFGYNPKYKEVMITIGNKTLVFNENTRSFAPRHSTVPKMYLNNDYKLFSYIEDEDSSVDPRYIYQHGIGERGEVYSEGYLNDLSTSFVTVIVNPNSGDVAAFDLIRFNTEVYENGNNVDTSSDLIEDTINSIECKNTYQSATKDLIIDTAAIRESGVFDTTVNTSRRARYWTTQLPINEDGNRLVDNTLILTLKYLNNDNKLFKLQDLITHYRDSK